MTHLLEPVRSRRRPAAAPEAALRAVDLRQRAGGAELLRGVSATIHRGELVAVLGPSGAGKSLLIELLAGASRPAEGHLSVLGRDLACVRDRIGYVPQAEVVHEALTVREALVSAARLRAPQVAASRVLLETRLAQVVSRLQLSHRLDVRVGRLSGGERRRVSLAVELITEPEVLVLDEVTSGLDAAAERRVVETLAGLAREGRAIVCTTHTLATADLFHRVLVVCGGRLVFDGSPRAALEAFDIPRIEALYERLRERAPEAWEARFLAQRLERPALAPTLQPRPAPPGPPGLHQLPTLVARQLRVTAREGWSLGLLLAQGPVIAALVAFAYDAGAAAGRVEVGFKLALAAIWLGCISSCQDLVKERTIYRRERLAGLCPHAYLAAKVLVMLLVALAHAATLGLVTLALEPLGAPAGDLLLTLAGAAVVGGGLGLAISAAARSRTAAVGATPLVLVPQILFVGTLVPLEGLARAAGQLMPSYWADQAVRGVLLDGGRAPAAELAVLAVFLLVFLAATWGLVLTRDATQRTVRS